MKETNSPKTSEVEKSKVFAEKLNGRLAILGVFALVGAYVTTGQIIPGWL